MTSSPTTTSLPSSSGRGCVVDLAEKLAQFSEHWSPKVVAALNDYEIKVVKVSGEFVWHSHAETDELFLVIDGRLRGVEHCPLAKDGEVSLVLIEPVGVVDTGEAGGELTAPYDASLLG